jgi:hypothetical protein
MKKIAIVTTWVLLAWPCIAAEDQQPNKVSMDDNLAQQIYQCKQQIENHYQVLLAEMRQRSDQQIRLLEVAERSKPACIGLEAWVAFVEEVLRINGCDPGQHDWRRPTPDTAGRRLAVGMGRIAQLKSEIVASSELEAMKLQRHKEYAMAAAVRRIGTHAESSADQAAKTLGLISGIVYAQDNPLVIIDGQILRQGQSIHGVRVIRIHHDHVDLERDSTTWTQKVGQPPADNWPTPKTPTN